jgi:hypothetical protein
MDGYVCRGGREGGREGEREGRGELSVRLGIPIILT